MKRRTFIVGLGSAAAWPVVGRAQQPPQTVALVSGRPDESVRFSAAFRTGLSETGHVESQNVTVEYHWLSGQYERLPSLMADFVRRRGAVIVSPDSAPTTLAAKAATATIPIVFGVGDEPVKLGIVASLARPASNATGISFLNQVIVSKQLGLLHELIPNAVRIAVLVNPANAPSTEATIENTSNVARALGLQIQVFKASTSREIEVAFAALVREQAQALFISAESFLSSRRVQLATLAARYAVPTAQPTKYGGSSSRDLGARRGATVPNNRVADFG
jgi:putative ABC transport system substrate-binding protein